MILILAGNYLEAKRWADGQLLDESEWIYPTTTDQIRTMKNFHTLVVGTAGLNVHPSYFENVLKLAKERGRMK